MEAAFIDIGLERNGFLHVDEIVLPGGQAVPRPRPRPAHRRADQAGPGDHRPGRQGPPEDEGRQALHAALDRGPLSGLHAAGRRDRVSKRLPDNERQRLRKLIEKVDIGDGGVIVRTAAQGRSRRTSSARSPTCTGSTRWSPSAPRVRAGQMVFQEADLSIRVVRDVLVEEFEGAIIDDPSSTSASRSSCSAPPRARRARRALQGQGAAA